MAAETGVAPEKHPEACRQLTQSALEPDDVERTRVELNRRAREEAGTARQSRGGGFEDLPVGEPTVIDKLKGEMFLKKQGKLGVAENEDKHCTVLNRPIDSTVDDDGPVV